MTDDQVSKEIAPFNDDDEAFIQWCYDHPDGFVLNYKRSGSISKTYLHAAIYCERLCWHFRNANRASGFEANLTGKSGKICSSNRQALERYLQKRHRGAILQPCSGCLR